MLRFEDPATAVNGTLFILIAIACNGKSIKRNFGYYFRQGVTENLEKIEIKEPFICFLIRKIHLSRRMGLKIARWMTNV